MGREEEEAESEGWDWADWNQLEPLSDPSWDAADETAVAQLSVRPEGWDVVGGLLGDFEQRLKAETGLDWA